MKSLVLSSFAACQLSETLLGVREQDDLIVQLHTSFEFISRTATPKFQQLSLKIDAMQIVFDLEIDSTKILIAQVHIRIEEC